MFNKNLFAKKLQNINPYTVDTSTYKIRLDANESFIEVPENIMEDFNKELSCVNFNRYPDPSATALCKNFADFFGIDAKNVAAGNGSDEIISVIINGFADKGDTVVTFSPDFSMYNFYSELAELKCINVPKENDSLQIDFEKADECIKQEKAKMCIFSNPCNPTGRIEKKSDIENLAKNNPDTLFIIDEAYMDFAKDKDRESFIKNVSEYENIIVLKTLSKAIGCASLRIGFVVAPEVFCDMFKAVKSPYNLNSVSQKFGEIILKNKDFLKDSTDKILAERDKLFDSINNLGIAGLQKMHTNFIFFTTPLAEEIFAFLKSKGILIRKFSISGGAVRITTGTSKENSDLICALEEFKNSKD